MIRQLLFRTSQQCGNAVEGPRLSYEALSNAAMLVAMLGRNFSCQSPTSTRGEEGQLRQWRSARLRRIFDDAGLPHGTWGCPATAFYYPSRAAGGRNSFPASSSSLQLSIKDTLERCFNTSYHEFLTITFTI